jgi:hypothetical protein
MTVYDTRELRSLRHCRLLYSSLEFASSDLLRGTGTQTPTMHQFAQRQPLSCFRRSFIFLRQWRFISSAVPWARPDFYLDAL